MLSLLRGIFLKAAFPILYPFARVFRVPRERLQQFLIRVNNRFVRASFKGRAERILILLPHCLQQDKCTIRITSNIQNCARCGKCGIKDLIGVAEEFDLDLYVATGGTLARRVVVETKPQAIVAVACERDLSSGISDTYPLPVLGVLNDRPFGPCFNTRVDLDRVRDAIRFFTADAGT